MAIQFLRCHTQNKKKRNFTKPHNSEQ